MHQMTVDPKTGFLQQPNYHPAFDAVKKLQILDYLENHQFKIRKACEFVGVDPVTFYKHMEIDPVFREHVQTVKEVRVEEIEQKLADMALKDEQVADRIFFLKSWKPERYNPVVKSENIYKVSVEINGLNNATDRQNVIETQAVGGSLVGTAGKQEAITVEPTTADALPPVVRQPSTPGDPHL